MSELPENCGECGQLLLIDSERKFAGGLRKLLSETTAENRRLKVLYEATANVAVRLQKERAEWTTQERGRMILTPAGQRALDQHTVAIDEVERLTAEGAALRTILRSVWQTSSVALDEVNYKVPHKTMQSVRAVIDATVSGNQEPDLVADPAWNADPIVEDALMKLGSAADSSPKPDTPAYLCDRHSTNDNQFDPDGCIACQNYTKGYLDAKKHNAERCRLRHLELCALGSDTADSRRTPEVVIVSYRMDSRGFRDTMFYTGRHEYGVALLDHDAGNAMRYTESDAERVIAEESWPYDVGTIPVMGESTADQSPKRDHVAEGNKALEDAGLAPVDSEQENDDE